MFQDLLSSAEPAACQRFALHAVPGRLGNSQPVATRHYVQVHDEDFERAAKCAQNAAQSRAPEGEGAGIARTPTPTHAIEKRDVLVGSGAFRPLQ